MKRIISFEVDIPDDLLKASDEDVQDCFDYAIHSTVNQVFYEMQSQVGIESGDEPLDSNIHSMETSLAEECKRVFNWQCESREGSFMKDKEIINWLDSEVGWDDIINEIKSRCKLEDAEYIAMKVVRDFGYRRKDAHVPNPSTGYMLTSDINLYDELSDLVQGEDCKNGCQLYQEPDGTYYFQITGANFYDKEDRYAGTDTVKVWFKEFKW